MKRKSIRIGAAIAAVTAGALALAGCSSGGADGAPAEVKEINLLTWTGDHEPEWLAPFEEETGVKVNVQYITSVPEAFAKVQADPNAFDLVLVTSGWVENYVDADLVVPFDESKLTNLGNTIEELDWRATTTYNGTNYGLTYTWGVQPLVIATDRVSEVPTSWNALWEPQYTGRVSMLDDPTTQLPAVALAAGIEDPYAMSDAEFATFQEKLAELRPQLTHVAGSIQDQTTDFTSNQTDIGILYNINTYTGANDAGTSLQMIIPEEGVAGWTDNYVLTKAGEAKGDIIYEFIDYTMTPEWMARMAAEMGISGNLSLEQMQSEAAVAAGLTPELLARTEVGIAIDDPEFFGQVKMLRRVDNVEEWLTLWNEFKLNVH